MAKSGDIYQGIVKNVLQALSPGAQVTEGEWVEGPDGRRDRDVTIRGRIKGRSVCILVECKDWKKRVPIGAIDGLESKRHDLDVDLAMICSNSGFAEPALRKAARVGIAAISILSADDERIKAEIYEEVVAEKIGFHSLDVKGILLDDTTSEIDLAQIRYRNLPVINWLTRVLNKITLQNKDENHLTVTFEFVEPTLFESGSRVLLLKGFVLDTFFSKSWVRQVAHLDATKGIYDYIFRHVGVPSGESIQIRLENDAWEEIPTPENEPYSSDPNVEVLLITFVANPLSPVENTEEPDIDSLISNRDVVIGPERPPS